MLHIRTIHTSTTIFHVSSLRFSTHTRACARTRTQKPRKRRTQADQMQHEFLFITSRVRIDEGAIWHVQVSSEPKEAACTREKWQNSELQLSRSRAAPSTAFARRFIVCVTSTDDATSHENSGRLMATAHAGRFGSRILRRAYR